MGSFSNKKKPCPICGNPTPPLFVDAVEGTPICKECSKKADMPDGFRKGMSLEDFRQYIVFYEDNRTSRETFQETFQYNCSGYNDAVSLDIVHGLFRLKANKDSLVLEASSLRSFRIREDDTILFESSPEGLKWYETNTIDRAKAVQPLIDQYKLEMQHYEQIKWMNERMEEMEKQGKATPGYSAYIVEPSFDVAPPIERFYVELTLDHTYWGGVRTLEDRAPDWGTFFPSVRNFMSRYNKKLDALHGLAGNLMNMIAPGAPEIKIPLSGSAGGAAKVRLVTDPVEEIRKYKAQLLVMF